MSLAPSKSPGLLDDMGTHEHTMEEGTNVVKVGLRGTRPEETEVTPSFDGVATGEDISSATPGSDYESSGPKSSLNHGRDSHAPPVESKEYSLLSSDHTRRQAHIASEQKRRQSINEGFDELRKVVPTCSQSQDSKAVVLRKSINYIRKLQGELTRTRNALAQTQSHVPQQSPYPVQMAHGGGYPPLHPVQVHNQQHPLQQHQNIHYQAPPPPPVQYAQYPPQQTRYPMSNMAPPQMRSYSITGQPPIQYQQPPHPQHIQQQHTQQYQQQRQLGPQLPPLQMQHPVNRGVPLTPMRTFSPPLQRLGQQQPQNKPHTYNQDDIMSAASLSNLSKTDKES